MLRLDEDAQEPEVCEQSGEGFVPTHKTLFLHNTHVRRMMYLVAQGKLNCVFTDKDGFGIRVEWKGNFLTFTPGIVTGGMPKETLWMSHASFWEREQHLKEIKREQGKVAKEREIAQRSAEIIQQDTEEIY